MTYTVSSGTLNPTQLNSVTEIISELFLRFISHVTTSETEIKLFQLHYFSNSEHVGKYS